MKEIPLSHRDPAFEQYCKEMVSNAPKYEKKPGTSVQCASTQRILDRPKEKDAEWFNRPIPKEAVIPKELWPDMKFDPAQVVVIEDIRKKGRNTLGASTESSVTKERREAAVNAFVYSPPAEVTRGLRDKIVEMTGYSEPPIPVLPTGKKKKLPLDVRIMEFFGLPHPWRKERSLEDVDFD